MPRASGASAKLAIKKEATYGVAATGNYLLVPFISFDLAAKDQVDDNPVLGYGRDAQRPARGVIDVGGSVVVPVDTEAFGWWLTALFGAPVTTGGAAPYSHVFKSGAASLPSFTVELQHPDTGTPLFELFTGVSANSLSLDFAPTGRPQATIALQGKAEAKSTASAAGTPTSSGLTWFHQRVNSLKRDGTAIAKIPAFSLTYGNNLEIDRYVGGGGEIGEVVPGQGTATGNLRARFADSSLHALAVAGTAFDLEAGWTNSVNEKLLFELEQAELLRAGRTVNGPGGIEETYDVRGSKDLAEGQMLKVTLTNAVSAYA